MENNPIKAIELSLSALRVLLYGDERLEGIEPRSKGLGDTAKVKIIPYNIGQTLKEIDKDEELFHVEFYLPATAGDLCWAEIWLSFEWRESNTRRSRQQIVSAENRISREKNKHRLDELASKLRSFGFDKHPGFSEHLAEAILKGWKNEQYTDVLKMFNLAETLNRFDEEDKEV